MQEEINDTVAFITLRGLQKIEYICWVVLKEHFKINLIFQLKHSCSETLLLPLGDLYCLSEH